MKRLIHFFLAFTITISISAQISPESYSVEHKDSNWYVTLDYEIEKMPSREGMLLITHLCNPDTCISSDVRHFQGKKYAKRYIKRHGHQPNIHNHGSNQCIIALPERYASDTLWGVTYCEYNSNDNNTYFSLDTIEIILPDTPPLSCHRVDAALTIADHIAKEHPYVKSIRHYTPLQNYDYGSNEGKRVVRYRTNSPILNTQYMQNAESIDELMSIINNIIADSSTTIEAVQLIGYTSPDNAEKKSSGLGYQRALALREHIRKQHSLPDSIFELANGGYNWNLIYQDIAMLDTRNSDSLINMLKKEPSATRRETLLRTYDNGSVYKELSELPFGKHRGTSVNAIYYSNNDDSVAIAINNIVNELIDNPAPDYHKLSNILHEYRNDARAINLQGVIDYRRHRYHAAKKLFEKAANMGDEQAAINFMIVQKEH